MIRDKVLKRIKFTDQTWREIKTLVCPSNNNRFSSLELFFDEAVSCFMTNYPAIDETEYVAVPRAGQYHSLWLERDVFTEVKARSNKENTFENRIIYTAVIFFLTTQ